MPRLFTALEIPRNAALSLSLLRGGLPGARWIDVENYHITLRFIGDVDGRTADEVVKSAGSHRSRGVPDQPYRCRFLRLEEASLRLAGVSSFSCHERAAGRD